jgi:hypothetical protein
MAKSNMRLFDIELEALKVKLELLIYMNEETMITPFDDYQEQRKKLEEQIQQLSIGGNK